MTQELLLALSGFAFVSSITPGPNNLMLMASGTNFGFARTVPHMLGVGIGFTLMIILVGAGLSAVFEQFPIAHTVLKYVSVAYLLWLAWKIATAPSPVAKSDGAAAKARPMTFIEAALFQWVNPKAWTMALTAVSAYTVQSSPVVSLLIVAGVFGLINLPCTSSWAMMGVQLRRLLDDPVKLRVFNVTAALVLIASLWPIVTGTH